VKRILTVIGVIALVMLAIGVAPALAQASTTSPPPNPTLDAQLKAIMADPAIPILGLQCVVVKDGKLAYVNSFGERYVDNADPSKDLAVNNKTMFRIASISKLVTTIGVMKQVEKGRIDLDADVSRYLGFSLRNPNYPDAKITMRMLLSHTSSIRTGTTYCAPATDTLKDFFFSSGKYWEDGAHWATPIDGTDASPGHYFCYSNLNFGVAATVLEAVTHERFTRYMHAHVLKPLGISGSWNVASFNRKQMRNLGVLYRKMDANGVWDVTGPWYPQVDNWHGQKVRLSQLMTENADTGVTPVPVAAKHYRPGRNATWESPQGGLRISALDLSKVMLLLMNDGKLHGHRILRASSVEAMLTPEWTYDAAADNGDTQGWVAQYGLGVQILSNNPDVGDQLLPGSDSPHWTGHPGEAYGMVSNMFFDRQSNDGYVYFCAGMGDDPYAHLSDYAPAFYSFDSAIIQALFDNVSLK